MGFILKPVAKFYALEITNSAILFPNKTDKIQLNTAKLHEFNTHEHLLSQKCQAVISHIGHNK